MDVGLHWLHVDYKPLLSILGATSEVPSMAAARMQRWGIFLSAYQYDVEYKRSKEHSNADGLSRLPIKEDQEEEDTAQLFHASFVDALPITAEEIAVETSKDRQLSQVYSYVMEVGLVKNCRRPLCHIITKEENCQLTRGAFYGV